MSEKMRTTWPAPYDKGLYSPWALFKGNDIYWLGMARCEKDAWEIGLGWPSYAEIVGAKASGIYAAPVGLTCRPLATTQGGRNG